MRPKSDGRWNCCQNSVVEEALPDKSTISVHHFLLVYVVVMLSSWLSENGEGHVRVAGTPIMQ